MGKVLFLLPLMFLLNGRVKSQNTVGFDISSGICATTQFSQNLESEVKSIFSLNYSSQITYERSLKKFPISLKTGFKLTSYSVDLLFDDLMLANGEQKFSKKRMHYFVARQIPLFVKFQLLSSKYSKEKIKTTKENRFSFFTELGLIFSFDMYANHKSTDETLPSFLVARGVENKRTYFSFASLGGYRNALLCHFGIESQYKLKSTANKYLTFSLEGNFGFKPLVGRTFQINTGPVSKPHITSVVDVYSNASSIQPRIGFLYKF